MGATGGRWRKNGEEREARWMVGDWVKGVGGREKRWERRKEEMGEGKGGRKMR